MAAEPKHSLFHMENLSCWIDLRDIHALIVKIRHKETTDFTTRQSPFGGFCGEILGMEGLNGQKQVVNALRPAAVHKQLAEIGVL